MDLFTVVASLVGAVRVPGRADSAIADLRLCYGRRECGRAACGARIVSQVQRRGAV